MYQQGGNDPGQMSENVYFFKELFEAKPIFLALHMCVSMSTLNMPPNFWKNVLLPTSMILDFEKNRQSLGIPTVHVVLVSIQGCQMVYFQTKSSNSGKF
jgi:hypothetical protein